MVPENHEIVKWALKNGKVEGLLITKSSDPAIKAVYQANREAKSKGLEAYLPDLKELEAKAPFTKEDLDYLRRYFTVTPTETIFGLTTEERSRVG
jgi:tRNA A37 threonylcarbamoyladenosine synthetase subunit TsaC/SUA5/YrdC